MNQPLLDKAWRRRKGGRFEQLALAWLQARGLELVQCNYRCKLGEIDLVMRERDLLVFVEVRARGGSSLVAACETVDSRKQQKLLRTARHFLLCNERLAKLPCRFDVLGIRTAQDRPCYEWIRDAFS
jgi:putative endonuclease